MGQIEFFFAQCNECYTVEKISQLTELNERYVELQYWKSYKTKYASSLKEELLTLMAKNIEYNRLNTTGKCLRKLNPRALVEKNVISVFESTLTRTLGCETDELTDSIMVVEVYYFEVIEDLILNGFIHNGEKYIFLTASAGQIRTKKTVFIKESLWEEYKRALMCGLTVDTINAMGGVNVNKYLAYLALSNSATDEWEDFDIDRCIVVPDFETAVHGTVDFIDDVTYEVDRREMDIDIEHTDGCGMMLPSVSKKNFMVRLPWIKGLLGVFDFRRFVEEHGASPVVTDIYGTEHDIIAEDIQIIFCKSQFKMHKYYDNWNQYKEYYKRYGCQAGTCKKEEDYISPASINYQMLQTLTDITDEEILEIAKPAIDKINNLTSNVSSMLDAFGAVKRKKYLSPFQEALLLYPEMLNDKYCKRRLNDIKNSMVKSYHAGKLPVKGKYTFVLPDLYAVCEKLFLHIENPDGLLQNGEVSCRLYKRAEKLDCLRAPHLYREHAVRKNVFGEDIEKWFNTDAVYISCKDLISKVLQCDFDGDTLLVVADKTIIEVAERNMQGIVPLYYDMKKAEPIQLSNMEFYNGMTAAWTGGNIGKISNNITKIWNSSENVGDDELLAVKILCMENNFVIDFAKTLYSPHRPKDIDAFLEPYTNTDMPYFFIDAKNHPKNKVLPINGSFVNKLRRFIKKKQLSFKRFSVFSYCKLMSDTECNYTDPALIEKYYELSKQYRHRINVDISNANNQSTEGTNISYIIKLMRKELLSFGYSVEETADMIVKEVYLNDTEAKAVLWMCFGDVLFENLKRRVNPRETYCRKCGERFIPRSGAHIYCDRCHLEKHKKADERIVICKDCGKVFTVPNIVRNKARCDECQHEVYKARDREKKRRKRAAL